MRFTRVERASWERLFEMQRERAAMREQCERERKASLAEKNPWLIDFEKRMALRRHPSSTTALMREEGDPR